MTGNKASGHAGGTNNVVTRGAKVAAAAGLTKAAKMAGKAGGRAGGTTMGVVGKAGGKLAGAVGKGGGKAMGKAAKTGGMAAVVGFKAGRTVGKVESSVRRHPVRTGAIAVGGMAAATAAGVLGTRALRRSAGEVEQQDRAGSTAPDKQAAKS